MGLDPFEEAGGAIGVVTRRSHRFSELYCLPTDTTYRFFRFSTHRVIVLTILIFKYLIQFLHCQLASVPITVGSRGEEGCVGGDGGGDGTRKGGGGARLM